MLIGVLAAAGCDTPTENEAIAEGHARVYGVFQDGIGQGVQGVEVMVPFGQGGHYGSTTDEDGRYQFDLPIDEYEGVSPVIMIARKQGYRPYTVTYARIENQARYNFTTTSSAPLVDLEPGEFVSSRLAGLVHFGNDQFGGDANSKLQVASSGLDLAFKLTAWDPVIAIAKSARITFKARGVQSTMCPNSIVALVSATGYEARSIPGSDPNGNFSNYNLAISLPRINQGDDLYVRVVSAPCGSGDWDDFEIAAMVVILEF